MKSSDNHAVRGAIYARVSAERQAQAGTIESQVAQLKERVQQDGLALDEAVCFIDDGYSGRSDLGVRAHIVNSIDRHG